MKFAVVRCATMSLEERTDWYDEFVDHDPGVQDSRIKVVDLLDNLRRFLEQNNAPQEVLQMIDDLDDEIVRLECADITAVAKIACMIGACPDMILSVEQQPPLGRER